jgi:hypothetical protein
VNVNPYPYDRAALNCVKTSQSPERLQVYLVASNGDDERAAKLYAWNTALSAAFYGPLQIVEVALRNAINRELTAHFRRLDWYDDGTFRLTHFIESRIEAAKVELSTKGKPIDNPHLVAQLGFGFWNGLLGPGHMKLHEMRLWRFPLRRAFVNLPSATRLTVHDDVNKLRMFRNGIAHHEAIFTRDHIADHQRILRVAGWLYAGLPSWVAHHSRCLAVIAQKPVSHTF